MSVSIIQTVIVDVSLHFYISYPLRYVHLFRQKRRKTSLEECVHQFSNDLPIQGEKYIT